MSSLAGGAWVEVIAQKETAPGIYSPDEVRLALATGVDYDEDFGIQPLEVLGYLGPREFNSHSYSCTINMQTLVTRNKAQFNAIIPNRSDVQDNGQLPNWLLSFRSTRVGTEIYAQFKGCVVASNGQQIQANQFATSNVRWMSIERIPDPAETGGKGGVDTLTSGEITV